MIYYVVYQIIVFLGVDTDLLKMLSAIVVALFLGIPNIRVKLRERFGYKKHARGGQENA